MIAEIILIFILIIVVISITAIFVVLTNRTTIYIKKIKFHGFEIEFSERKFANKCPKSKKKKRHNR